MGDAAVLWHASALLHNSLGQPCAGEAHCVFQATPQQLEAIFGGFSRSFFVMACLWGGGAWAHLWAKWYQAGRGHTSPTNALSLVREVFYDPATEGLLVLPMAELSLLRQCTGNLPLRMLHLRASVSYRLLVVAGNGSLFAADAVPLKPGVLFTPPLSVAGGGATADVEATFTLPAGAGLFGISVLADNATLLDSAVIQINVSAADAASGLRTVTASGGINQ